MMEFINSTYHVARKEHSCEACEQVIQKGEKYEYECGKFDGEFFERRYHIECFQIMQDFFSDMEDTEFCYDEVNNWWEDVFCSECEKCEDNGGTCDRDKDKRIWCTKFKRILPRVDIKKGR